MLLHACSLGQKAINDNVTSHPHPTGNKLLPFHPTPTYR